MVETKNAVKKKGQVDAVVSLVEAKNAVWSVWDMAWQILKDEDGSHTTNISVLQKIKQKAIEQSDKLETI